jgi:hypothetical protein
MGLGSVASFADVVADRPAALHASRAPPGPRPRAGGLIERAFASGRPNESGARYVAARVQLAVTIALTASRCSFTTAGALAGG